MQNGPRLQPKPGPVVCDGSAVSYRPFAREHVTDYVLALAASGA